MVLVLYANIFNVNIFYIYVAYLADIFLQALALFADVALQTFAFLVEALGLFGHAPAEYDEVTLQLFFM